MTERHLPFTSSNYVANAAIAMSFKGAAFRELGLRVSGSTSGTAYVAPLADELPWPLVGPLELVSGGQSRFRVEAATLFHLSAFYNGGYAHRTAPAGGATGGLFSGISLPFHKMMDGAGLDATGQECFIRGQWRPTSYLAATVTGTVVDATTRLDAWVKTVLNAPPAGFLEPEWQQATHSIDTSNNSRQHTIDFKKNVLLPGLLLEVLDASGGGGTDAAAGVDGLLKRFSVELNTPGEASRTIIQNETWGMARFDTCRMAGYSADDETASVGVAFVPLFERRGGARRDALWVPAGSSITISYDTQATVDGGYTNVAPAASDVVRVLVPAFLATPDQALAASASQLARDRVQLAQRAVRGGQSTERARRFLRG